MTQLSVTVKTNYRAFRPEPGIDAKPEKVYGA